MTIIKAFVALSPLFFLVGAVNAQSYETFSTWNKNNVPCVAVEVNASEEIAIKSLFDLLKSENLKGKKSKKTLKFEKVVFSKLTSDYINLYASVSSKGDDNSVVYLFVNEGLDSEFVSSHADRKLIDNLKNFLDSAYSPAASKANLEFRLAAQAKLIKGSGKSLSKYEKDLDKKIKQREKLGNQIDELTQQIQEQKMLLQQQNLDLNNIGN